MVDNLLLYELKIKLILAHNFYIDLYQNFELPLLLSKFQYVIYTLNRKNMRLFFLAIFFLFFLTISQAQQIFICQSVSENGKPVGSADVWKIGKSGGYINVLLSNDKPLPKGVYYIMIDKKNGKDYQEYESKSVRINESKYWFSVSYTLKEPGDYEVYITGPNQQNFGEERISVRTNEPESVKTIKADYSEASIIICEQVIAEKPIKAFNTISLAQRQGTVFFYLKNKSSINSKMIIVEIYKKAGKEYDKLIDTKKFGMKPSWAYSFFKYKFKETGDYKIVIYNENKNIITSRTFTVTN